MGYVIYDKQTTRIVSRTYRTHAAAQAALTRMRKARAGEWGVLRAEQDPLFIYGIAEESYFYQHIERTVERVNLMSGEKYMEPVNTPGYMSPASEAYWSM